MKPTDAKYLIAAALLITLAGLWFAGVFSGSDDKPGEPADPPVADTTSTAPALPVPTIEPTQPAVEVVPGFDKQVAVEAATARSTWSWQDRDTLDWADRLARLSTDNYADQLGKLPVTAVDENEWTDGIVSPEATSRVARVKVTHLDGSLASGTVDVRVRYDVEVSYGKPELIESHAGEGMGEPQPAPAAGEWVRLYPQTVNMRFVHDDGQWLLDAVAYPAG